MIQKPKFIGVPGVRILIAETWQAVGVSGWGLYVCTQMTTDSNFAQRFRAKTSIDFQHINLLLEIRDPFTDGLKNLFIHCFIRL